MPEDLRMHTGARRALREESAARGLTPGELVETMLVRLGYWEYPSLTENREMGTLSADGTKVTFKMYVEPEGDPDA
ncbi:MAG: hypothetical protein GY701_26840 [Sulfitobacter sp.]|nr:hypothetical protein [Sulfitobacter sp.]